MNHRLSILILFCVSILCGEIRFSVTADKSKVVAGELLLITATVVSDQELNNPAPPVLPESDAYTVVKTSRNQNHSSSIQIVNGRMNQTVEITYLFYYYLQFLKQGSVTIAPLVFTHDGKQYSSAPLSLNAAAQAAPATRDIVVSLRLNKKQLFTGEQGLLNFEVAKRPAAPIEFNNEGFLSILEQIERNFGKNFSLYRLFSEKIGRSQKEIDGEPFEVYTLSYSIIPINAGTYSIPPVSFEYYELQRNRSQSRDPFEDFFNSPFFGSAVSQVAKSAVAAPLSITVKPLPTPPADFSGAVGACTFSASLSHREIAAGEPVTLTIKLQGFTRPGNLMDPKLPTIIDIDLFPPEKQIVVDTSAIGIETRKKFSYILIPKKEGEVTIPPIQFTYFDPAKESYSSITTKPLVLNVTPNEKSADKQQNRYFSQEEIRELGQDIRYIKTASSLKQQSPFTLMHILLLYPIPFILALFAYLYRLQSTNLKKDPALLARRRAYRASIATLDKCRKELAGTVTREGIEKISDALICYISDRFSFSASGKTVDQIKTELTERRIDPAMMNSLESLLESLDRYRFCGQLPTSQELERQIDQSANFIKTIEMQEKKR